MAAAYVRVSPDLDGFAEELESEVEEAAAGVEAKVKARLDDAELDAALADAKAKLDELDGKDATARLRADDGDLAAKADDATARLRELGDAEATAQLHLDKAGFDAGKDEAKAGLDDLGGEQASPKLTLDTTEFWAQADAATAELEVLKSAGGGTGAGTGGTPAIRQDSAGRWRSANGRFASPEEIAAAGVSGIGGGIPDGGGGGGRSGGGFGGYFSDLVSSAGEGSEGGEGSLIGAATLIGGGLLPGLGGAVAGLGLLGATGYLALGGVGSALSAAHQASQSTGLTPQQTAATSFSNQVQVGNAQQSVTQAKQQQAQSAETSSQSIEQAEMNLASVTRNAAASQVQAYQSVQQAQQGVQQATYSLSEANYNLGQAYEQARTQITQLNDQLADSKLSVSAASLAVKQAQYQETLVNQDAYSTDLTRQQATLAVAQAKQQLQDATDSETSAQYNANLANQQGVNGSQVVIQAKQAQKAAQDSLTNASNSAADAATNLKNTELNNASQVKQAQMQVAQAQEQAAYQARQDAQSVAQAEQNLTNTIKEQQLQWAATESTANQAANQFKQDMAKLTPSARGLVNQVLGLSGAYDRMKAAAQNAVVPGLSLFVTGLSKLMPTVQSGVTQMGGAISKMFGQVGKAMESSGAQKTLQGLFTNGLQFVNTVLPAIVSMVGSIMSLGSQKGAVSGLADLIKGIADGISGFAKGLKPYIPDFDLLFQALGKIVTAVGPALAKILGSMAQDLAPLAKFLDSKRGTGFIDAIGKIVAGMLALKGLAKILPGELGKAVGGAPGTIAKVLSKPLKSMLSSAFKSAFGTAAKDGEKAAGDELGSSGSGWLSGLAGGLKSKLSPIFKGAFGGAAKDGEEAAAEELGGSGGMSGLIGGIGSLLSGIPGKITPVVEGIKSWGIWSSIASGATKVWTGIQAGFNLVMDANPIGIIVLALAGLAIGIYEAYKHFAWFRDGLKEIFGGIEKAALFLWHDVFEKAWDGIEKIAEDAWNFIYNGFGKYLLPMLGPLGWIVLGIIEVAKHWTTIWGAIKTVFDDATHGIALGAEWLYDNGIKPLWTGINTVFGYIEKAALWLWHNVFDPVWHGIESGVSAFVGAFKSTWNTLESIFKTPVNFLINTVYDGGIRKLWNGVVGAVHLSSLDLPNIPALSHGGVLPGYSPGRDTVPAMLSPGEAVLTPGATRAIGGAGTVNALNSAYPPGGGGGARGHFAGGGLVQYFWPGGIVSDIVHGAEDVLSGGETVGKAVAALVTGNTTAFVNALAPSIGTSASGALGQVMVALPKTLLTDAAKKAESMLGGGGASGGAASLPQLSSWFTQAAKLAGAPASWIPDLETIAIHESSDNPNAINMSDSNAAAGDPSRGLMQLIATTFDQYHVPGTSMSIFDPVANIAAGIGYIRSRYGTPGAVPGIVSLAQGGQYVGYDSGGVLPPGMTMAVNQSGKPEAVLTADEAAAFKEIIRQLAGNGTGAPGDKAPVNNLYFTGPQMPGQEQLAEMFRQLSLVTG